MRIGQNEPTPDGIRAPDSLVDVNYVLRRFATTLKSGLSAARNCRSVP
jgi:hypothetical protein